MYLDFWLTFLFLILIFTFTTTCTYIWILQICKVFSANFSYYIAINYSLCVTIEDDFITGWQWIKIMCSEWASCQIRKIAVCACAGNAGNVFSAIDFKGNHQIAIPACITTRTSRTRCDACRDRLPAVAGKTFPAHKQPAILHIWQEANDYEWICKLKRVHPQMLSECHGCNIM